MRAVFINFVAFLFGADAFLNPSYKSVLFLQRTSLASCRLGGRRGCLPELPSVLGFSARLIPPPPPPRFNGGPSRPDTPLDSRKSVSPRISEGLGPSRMDGPRMNSVVSIDDVLVKSQNTQNTPSPKKYFEKPKPSYRTHKDGRSFRSSAKPARKDTSPPPMLTRSDWVKAATIGGACE